MRCGAKVLRAFFALATVLVAVDAGGQAPIEAIRTEVHAGAGCADSASFFDQIHARTANARRAGANEEAQRCPRP